MSEKNFKISHLIAGFCAIAIASCLILLSPHIRKESAFMLVIFNFLFMSLFFPLGGTLTSKLIMLSAGNVIGWLWNYVFCSLVWTVLDCVGESFTVLYIILNPFINLIWIVPFWSISLTALSNVERKNPEAQT